MCGRAHFHTTGAALGSTAQRSTTGYDTEWVSHNHPGTHWPVHSVI